MKPRLSDAQLAELEENARRLGATMIGALIAEVRWHRAKAQRRRAHQTRGAHDDGRSVR